MPYILSPAILENSPGMWFEGSAYEKRNIYSIESGKMPPVNYDEHIIRSHSLTHLETPAHTSRNGHRLGHYYQEKLTHFFGKALVLRLTGNNYRSIGNSLYHWIITKQEIEDRLKVLKIDKLPGKILITTDHYPMNTEGFHDPNFILTLSQEAADFLISNNDFNLYGTSWKSSDFNPGQPDRPIHNTLFKKALILENLDLSKVPEDTYFITSFPLPFTNASESPVVPVLFTREELLTLW